MTWDIVDHPSCKDQEVSSFTPAAITHDLKAGVGAVLSSDLWLTSTRCYTAVHCVPETCGGKENVRYLGYFIC